MTGWSLFGAIRHSAGANHASYIALADPPVSPDCLAGADSAIPEDLVLFEGDWLLMGDPAWDSVVAEDLSVLRVGTPWSHLADGPRIPVTIVDSGDSSLAVRTQERIDRSLAIRDPDGAYRDGLDRAAALADEQLTMTDGQHLLAVELAGFGYPVYFVDLPGSTHGYLSDTALEMIADALMSGSAEQSSDARD